MGKILLARLVRAVALTDKALKRGKVKLGVNGVGKPVRCVFYDHQLLFGCAGVKKLSAHFAWYKPVAVTVQKNDRHTGAPKCFFDISSIDVKSAVYQTARAYEEVKEGRKLKRT